MSDQRDRLPSNVAVGLAALATLALPSVRARLGPARHAAEVARVTAATVAAARRDGTGGAGQPGQRGASVPGPAPGRAAGTPPTPKVS